ncbi:oligosaccharide repeat unit polymerase [Shewanella dokdonensis]|uniref:Oligosaccharide repeat unit polymerase n=1 Tax=Shewanella dokdonensis TaxID=712036 RepID=A0ABX8DG64_9GAMM|nr:O-antigen polymerase [Shewanella dokdonensis]QVK23670.1 oligosaccharide repeat unit polymerase [Shewanella dokdonensis]
MEYVYFAYGTIYLSAVIIYFFLLKKISAFTIFIFMAVSYSFAPIVFDNLGFVYYDRVVSTYKVYNIGDIYVATIFISISYVILIFFDFLFINSFEKLKIKFSLAKKVNNRTASNAFIFTTLSLMLLFFVMSMFGIKIFGINNFFHGYSDSSLAHSELMKASPGWSLYTNGAMFFYMMASMFFLCVDKNHIKKLVFILVLIFAAMNIYGGARLITVAGILAIYFSINGLVIKLSTKTIIYCSLFVLVFLAVGIIRSGNVGSSVGLLYSLLEFPFVGFGLYNIISVKPIFDTNVMYFFQDLVTFSLPAYLVDKSNVNRYQIVQQYFPDTFWISPIGGNFFITDMYLYFGVLFPFFMFMFLFLFYIFVKFIEKLKVSNFSILTYSFLIWCFTYGLFG